jgi:hypothetical protein
MMAAIDTARKVSPMNSCIFREDHTQQSMIIVPNTPTYTTMDGSDFREVGLGKKSMKSHFEEIAFSLASDESGVLIGRV